MDGDRLAESKRSIQGKPSSVRTDWMTGRRTPQWDLLWTRLLAYATEHRTLPDEASGAVALRDPSDSEPSATSDDSRRPDDEQRGP
jgi:hypothetical protein